MGEIHVEGDYVEVTSGKYKGETGILRETPRSPTAIVNVKTPTDTIVVSTNSLKRIAKFKS